MLLLKQKLNQKTRIYLENYIKGLINKDQNTLQVFVCEIKSKKK